MSILEEIHDSLLKRFRSNIHLSAKWRELMIASCDLVYRHRASKKNQPILTQIGIDDKVISEVCGAVG